MAISTGRADRDRPSRPTRVDYLDLEKLLPEGPIHLLKCDIEGSEEATFAAYPTLLRRVRNVAVELHPELCNIARCRALLSEAGLCRAQVQREEKAFTVERWARRSPRGPTRRRTRASGGESSQPSSAHRQSES